MGKSLKSRIDELEKQAKKANNGPAYITIQEGEEIPEGFTGKVYVGFSPDDWDEDPLDLCEDD